MMEAICWVFDTIPSRVNLVLWSHSHRDIKMKTQLRVGFEQAQVMQNYETLGLIASQVFGGSSDTGPKPPQTADEAVAQFTNIFGKGAVM